MLPPRAALGAAALALAGGVHAAGLFLPEGPATGAKAHAVPTARGTAAASDAWKRHVRIDRHQLAATRDDVEHAGLGRLLLNLKEDVRLDVVVERTAPTKFGYSLSGRVVDGAAQVGFVTLVVHEKAVAGTVWTPDSAYELSYLGDGLHALRDVTNAPPVECAGTLPPESSALEPAVEVGTVEGSVVVDILVVWTPAEEEWVGGGEAGILSWIDQGIAYINDAFERSGALVQLRLVGAERVDYLETDIWTDMTRLVTPDDGYMDGVLDRRNALGADLVHLKAIHNGGLGVVGGAFSINAMSHEVGHNFGIFHERHDRRAGMGGYEHGFTTADCFDTIMSIGEECVGRERPAPFYASPWRYVPTSGRPFGMSRLAKKRGARGPADAVLTLNRNRHRVANYRPSRAGE